MHESEGQQSENDWIMAQVQSVDSLYHDVWKKIWHITSYCIHSFNFTSMSRSTICMQMNPNSGLLQHQADEAAAAEEREAQIQKWTDYC